MSGLNYSSDQLTHTAISVVISELAVGTSVVTTCDVMEGGPGTAVGALSALDAVVVTGSTGVLSVVSMF